MNKAELVEIIAKKTSLSKADAAKAVNAVITETRKALAKGNTVQLIGLGTFGVQKRKARIGRHPQTGAVLKIKAKKVPHFRPGKALKDSVN